jgi:hypothetical protein
MSRATPFTEGIPGRGWKRRHPKLTLRASQTLEIARTRGLCEDNVKSFYDNLQILYSTHNYSPDRIWNCDESGAQAGKNGGGIVIVRTGARRVHSIVPDQREWLSVLVCINAAGFSIPFFYIFRGKRFGQNYIQRCEPGATMAMQPRAWMTSYLFGAWVSRFIELVRESGSISQEHRHLLILDGQISHVSVEIVQEARRAGLDILTLPSHTSHALQPLDVSVFKPFKQFFRQYRDYWMSRNLNQPASKDTLAQWVSLSLKKALTERNITKGFSATGIWPVNVYAMDSMLGPSQLFCSPLEESCMGAASLGACSEEADVDRGDVPASRQGHASRYSDESDDEDEPHLDTRQGATSHDPGHADQDHHEDDEVQGGEGHEEEDHEDGGPPSTGAEANGGPEQGGHGHGPQLDIAEMAVDFVAEPDAEVSHFFVNCDTADPEVFEELVGLDPTVGEPTSITRFLTLPIVTRQRHTRIRDPIFYFSQSKILTSDEYAIASAQLKYAKEMAEQLKEQQRMNRQESKRRKEVEEEEGHVARAAAKEDAARTKELRVAEQVEVRARKQAQRDETQRLCAEQLALAASTKAAKAAEKGRKATAR